MAAVSSPGEVRITGLYDDGALTGYRIDHADPVILVNCELMIELRRNANLWARVEHRDGAPDLLYIVGLDGRPGALAGAWLELVYCIGAYDPERLVWQCYWPD